jgi:anti-sigma regulatory factor (Ser/Thr protein kinase)
MGVHAGYRHEALFYAGPEAFLAGTVPFVRAALAADEPVMVLVRPPGLDALQQALGSQAERVMFADIARAGVNPARIIPLWQKFLAENARPGRGTRGVGEPIWADRSVAELVECDRHEALLNIAFGDVDFWLLCPYDTTTLEPAVLSGALRNHPWVRQGSGSRPNPDFSGGAALSVPLESALPAPPAWAEVLAFDVRRLREVRSFVSAFASATGVGGDWSDDFVIAVNEVAMNSVVHGGGSGLLHLWRDGDALVCDIRDDGRIDDPLVGRRTPCGTEPGGRGLWLANQLCELVQIRSLPGTTVVRLRKRYR